MHVLSTETMALVARSALGDLLVHSGGPALSACFEVGARGQVCSGQSLGTATVPARLVIHSDPFPSSSVPVWLGGLRQVPAHLWDLVPSYIKLGNWGFPGGPVVTKPPCNARDVGLVPCLGRPHMPRSTCANSYGACALGPGSRSC